jgi:hypothetical protein
MYKMMISKWIRWLTLCLKLSLEFYSYQIINIVSSEWKRERSRSTPKARTGKNAERSYCFPHRCFASVGRRGCCCRRHGGRHPRPVFNLRVRSHHSALQFTELISLATRGAREGAREGASDLAPTTPTSHRRQRRWCGGNCDVCVVRVLTLTAPSPFLLYPPQPAWTVQTRPRAPTAIC